MQKSAEGSDLLVHGRKKVYGHKNFCVYFTYLPRSPLGQIYMKFCVRHHLADIINRVKFCLNRIRGFDSVGVEFLPSP